VLIIDNTDVCLYNSDVVSSSGIADNTTTSHSRFYLYLFHFQRTPLYGTPYGFCYYKSQLIW